MIELSITSTSTPFTMEGMVGGRPVWYRARGPRWELYEGTEQAMSGMDADGHLIGDGVTWLAIGERDPDDADSVRLAVDHVMEHCAHWISDHAYDVVA